MAVTGGPRDRRVDRLADDVEAGAGVHHDLSAEQVERLDAVRASWIMLSRLSRQYCSTGKSRV
jgi:hypothetical protein